MAVCLMVLLGLLMTGFQAEIIDRIAVTLDNQVITASEIALEIRLTAFLNGDPPGFSPAARRKAADRLIEQKLVRREMQVGRYAQPAPDDVGPMLQQIQAQLFHDPEEYRQALAKYGISEDDLKAHLLWQLSLLRFIDIRFRPGVQVTDDEIHTYFDQHLSELEKQAPAGKVTLDDVHDEIRRILTTEGVNKQLDDWLAQARKRAHIEVHEEAFR
jgi:peptidyl-prolyl cis-trans isomerase SurA